ncbi:MAG: hypothetical protein ACNA8H_02705 [Anaerolineales bacterium]
MFASIQEARISRDRADIYLVRPPNLTAPIQGRIITDDGISLTATREGDCGSPKCGF